MAATAVDTEVTEAVASEDADNQNLTPELGFAALLAKNSTTAETRISKLLYTTTCLLSNASQQARFFF